MKTARKVLLLVLCAVLLVSATVMGTLAYLQDTTEVVTNTFSVGEVHIDLDEAKVDEYGVAEENADRVKKNTYKLIPGHAYTKDPTVHVEAGSEVSYVFVKVENEIADIEAATKIADQMTAKGWVALTGVDNVFCYNTTVDAREEAQDLVVFETFTLTDDAEVEDYLNKTIKITAYAIQADGFDSASEAWTAGGFGA